MLPARDRITVLKVYPSKEDAKANTNGTSYTEGIVDNSARLERPFYQSLPGFGECNAAMFECELAINVDLTGKWIRVATQAYATDEATSRTTYWLFTGLVDSCKYDAQQSTRKLVAYDEMYTLRNTDVSAWWNTYFSTMTGNPGMGTVVGDMMTAFGVTGTAATTISDSYVLITSAQKSQLFSGCSFAQVLSYIGTARRMSFYMNATGALTACSYVSVNKTNTPVALDGNVDTNQSTFGDDVANEFSNFCVYDGTTVAYTDGSNPPTYAINDNPMLKGRNATQYNAIGTGMLATLKNMSGLRSAEIMLIVSSPDVVLVRPVAVSYNGVTYMASGITMSGPQLIDQTIMCTNAMQETPYYAASVTSTSIADGAVSAEKVADGAIGTAKLAELAVTEGKIAANAVTGGKIANLAVDNAKLAASAVTEGKLAANAVTEGKIAANAVVADKIASNAVTADKIAALAVTTGKLDAGAVTANKIASNAVTADKINAGAVTSAKIDAEAVVAEKIASGAVSTDKLAALAVTAAKIDSGAITTDKLAAGAVTTAKINVSVDMATNAGVASTYATKAAAASQEQRIYYRKSETGAPTAPTTWVTATATANESWTTKRMPYSSTYKYLYTCVQTKTVSGAVSNSTVLLDDTTTVIDGGNIITGTVDTNQLNANAVTAAKIATGAVTADKISVTDLQAIGATIGGWSLDSTRIFKEITIGDYVYQVYMNAPASPVAGNLAVGIRKRATNSSTWSYPCYFNYSGDFYATNAHITGGDVSGSTVGSGVDAGNLTTGTLSADRIGANTITAGKLSITDLQAIGATIAGWSISTDRIYKSVTSDGTTYEVALFAPATPGLNNAAFYVRKKASDETDWTYMFYARYNGQVYARQITVGSDSTVPGSTVGTGVDAGNLTTGTLNAARIAAGSLSTDKISVTDLQAFDATIAGWSLTSSQIKKSFTIDGVVYTAYMQAITNNPSATNGAFVISQTSNGTTTYPFIVRYNGNLIARNATIAGDVTATSGSIGGLTINNNSITSSNGAFQLDDTGTITLSRTLGANVTEENIIDTDGFMSTRKDDVSEDDQWIDCTGVHSHHRYDEYYDRVAIMSASEYNTDGPALFLSDYETRDGLETGTDEAIYSAKGLTISDLKNNKETKLNHSELVVGNTDVLASLSKIPQTVTTTSANYPLLFGVSSITANSQATTKTEAARISGSIFVNPNTATINARRIHTGTTSQYGRFVLGNSIANGTAGCSHGEMYIYGKSDKYVRFVDKDDVLTANREVYFPNQSGYLVVDAVTSGSGTRTTSGAASGSTATWSRTGKVVSVNVSSLKAASTSNPTELFSGLPKATQDTYFICQASATATYRHALLKITTDGKIVNAGDALSNTVAIYGNVMYITSD